MTENEHQEAPRDIRKAFPETIGSKAERKLKARSERQRSLWFGMGMFGVVGWSVAVPTVAAAALGIWIDRRWPSRFSWTLMLLFLGVVIGCWNAWFWIKQEGVRRHRDGNAGGNRGV